MARLTLRSLVGLIVLLGLGTGEARGSPQHTPEANKALVLQLVEAVNSRNLDLADNLLTPDYVQHNPSFAQGLAGFKQGFAGFLEAFPDLTWKVDDVVAEGDKIVARTTLTGTHRGEFLGLPATGRRVTFGTIDVWRVEDGRLAEHWDQVDNLGLLQQLGAIPTK